ncbi:hypothetical protein O7635_14665 [Asanoa sp. WMMD1127]|uniref:hypothetical protein n=1 Tax=Asanoa sp. WMMD1127 TaxID=3016107 RepID=UPI002415EA84|nr:hypothetical protein [Asanoa sp. WMMD1127]MDG4823095.1 hypothetical protein [Asanoa sp. WMMD1127]
MRIRRLITGLGVLSALAITVAACGSGDAGDSGGATGSAPPATSAAPADPKEELTAAARKLNETTMKMTLESVGTTSTGSLDPQRKLGEMTMKVAAAGRSLDIQIRTIGKDVYLQADGLPGTEGGKWLEIEGSRLAGSSFDVFPEDDPAGTNRLLNALSDVKKDGPGQFSATIDLNKTSNPNQAAQLGDKFKALPFKATVDDEGRLTSTEIDITSVEASAGKTKATYSDFGTTVTVEPPPAGDTVPASDQVVKMLTGG